MDNRGGYRNARGWPSHPWYLRIGRLERAQILQAAQVKRPEMNWWWWWAASAMLALTIIVSRQSWLLMLGCSCITMYFVRGGVVDITRFALQLLTWQMERKYVRGQHRERMHN